MAKVTTKFVCNSCGAQYSAWAGRCSQCGDWNTLVEETPLMTPAGGARSMGNGSKLQPQAVIELLDGGDDSRLAVHLGDIDTVLGGGLVPGGVVLLAGQPGIGKSTVLMQLAQSIAHEYDVLYVSGEESEHQVSIRASRLQAKASRLKLAASVSADDIAATIVTRQFQLVVVDSIQTMTASGVNSMPGTVSQITNSTNILLQAAKQSHTALIIVGHVTKEGSIAGPKVLEHIVDVVLQLDGDAYGGFKVLRAAKNRFGPTSETAIMEMTDTGLQPVLNPSQALLEERQITDGSVVLATLEGSRPLLVEVQALVNKTNYGYPKRAASGIDLTRVNLLVAMLERRTKLALAEYDIYLNIVGGLRLQDPAADLAVCLAIGSAAKGLPLRENAVVFGEVGLSGEVRHVPFIDKRIAEAKKLGFDAAIGPRQRSSRPAGKADPFLRPVQDVRSALNQLLAPSANT